MLELERLTNKVEAMAQRASEQLEQRQKQLDDLLQKLHDNRTNWSEIRRTLNLAQAMTDAKLFRAARPFDEDEPLDVTVAPVDPPHYAILNGVDGSQILPDRHAPYLYYLINVGIITYFHGRELAPTTETFPELVYPENEDADEGEFVDDGGVVNIRRDLQEISSLAEVCWQQRQETDVRVAVLDQRLLYWPTVRGQD
ncbi:MAG: DNA double-strand break repair nuclease NurA, partial [Anaerolineales bacterium]|nr:DNA double-strand break repair nuclease NurA [Anaerolineales bacterium]